MVPIELGEQGDGGRFDDRLKSVHGPSDPSSSGRHSSSALVSASVCSRAWMFAPGGNVIWTTASFSLRHIGMPRGATPRATSDLPLLGERPDAVLVAGLRQPLIARAVELSSKLLERPVPVRGLNLVKGTSRVRFDADEEYEG